MSKKESECGSESKVAPKKKMRRRLRVNSVANYVDSPEKVLTEHGVNKIETPLPVKKRDKKKDRKMARCGKWADDENERFDLAVEKYGCNYNKIVSEVGTRNLK